ncbi:hemoglobin-like flavoprotein [Rubidibacter lacunae KORDI 51-2]|uniref:Hemoglobin-like flavoprotein n=1 Tax=Rubidibacter lacunae KORDI 51-2 TaxID=582515 RepID=U5DJ61_9CHRO|nr:globin family protein [Rubidibacter lacunae]ERN40599.1 hemoglobin-like flavoprotein [Rubidibacter lacunae KORDI 51-2]
MSPDAGNSQEPGLQVQLLETSFEKVKPRAEEFASSFYENLFFDYPDAKPLFANADLKAQSKKLLASLVFVVDNLKNPDALTKALKGLGARHVRYGALPEHYPLVGNTLLKTFAQYLGDAWTPATEKAWTEVYGVITEVMLDGADYSPDNVKLAAVAATEAEAEAEGDSGLQVGLLEGSFALVKPRAEAFARSFYNNLFADYPAAKPLFSGTDMEAQSKKLLSSLDYVVAHLKYPVALSEALKGLGARHVQYGALPEHYPLVGNTLLKTFSQYLGEGWTSETEKAWTEAYGVITEVMLDGADYSQTEVRLESARPGNGVTQSVPGATADTQTLHASDSSDEFDEGTNVGLVAGIVAGGVTAIILLLLLL